VPPPRSIARAYNSATLNAELLRVVAGKLMDADVMTMGGKTVATVNGALMTTGAAKLNAEINAVKTDIVCTNGVIHDINSVLLPSA